MEKEILMAGIAALSQAISAEPTATLYKERGRLRMLAGASQGAMDDIRKAAELDPSMLEQFSGKFDNK